MTEISNEYASALFSLALESGQQKQYGAALDRISGILSSEPEYLDFLASPNIPIAERCGAAEKVFGEDVPEYVMSFLQLLCEKGKIRAFHECREAYAKLLAESERVCVAKVISAAELTSAEKVALTEKLQKKTGQTVTLECSVDSSIMGGVIIEIDGKVIDGSLRTRLADVKDVIGG